ncbi:MAG: competence protein CoiA [Streptococcaceae bacterium]|jgi:competence protein CoiA|nr:competence protein CoiA [Streptococcaceae bacterium]
MLTALNENHKLINLLDGIPKKQKFFCPACKSEVRLRCGPIKIPHFAHLSLEVCEVWSENESEQHLSLKKAIYDWVKPYEKVEVEKYLPELNQTPDLLINNKIAIEIQCSRLSIKRLKERTDTYRKYGYYVVWMLGKDLWLSDRISPLQKQFLYFSQNLGFYYWELDLTKKCLRVKYMIHENLKGKLTCLEKDFSFSRENFLKVLGFPFQCCKLERLQVKVDRDLKAYIQRELFHRNPKWMKLQEDLYFRGKNLLTESFPVQWAPIGSNILTGNLEMQFLQIRDDLPAYYKVFRDYYTKNSQKTLFPPAYLLKYWNVN